jgi:hypothetical protein
MMTSTSVYITFFSTHQPMVLVAQAATSVDIDAHTT